MPPPPSPQTESVPGTETAIVPPTESVAQITIAPYNPGLDLEMVSATLGRAVYNIHGTDHSSVAQDLSTVGTLLSYVESHLPSVIVRLGVQRIQIFIQRNNVDGARNAVQQLKNELQAVANLMPPGMDLLPVLTEVEMSLLANDTAKALDALNRMQAPTATSKPDPWMLIQQAREHLAGAAAAMSVQPPKTKIAIAELSDVEDLVSQLKSALKVAAPGFSPVAPGPSPTPPPAAAPRTPPASKSGSPPVPPAKASGGAIPPSAQRPAARGGAAAEAIVAPVPPMSAQSAHRGHVLSRVR